MSQMFLFVFSALSSSLQRISAYIVSLKHCSNSSRLQILGSLMSFKIPENVDIFFLYFFFLLSSYSSISWRFFLSFLEWFFLCLFLRILLKGSQIYLTSLLYMHMPASLVLSHQFSDNPVGIFFYQSSWKKCLTFTLFHISECKKLLWGADSNHLQNF